MIQLDHKSNDYKILLALNVNIYFRTEMIQFYRANIIASMKQKNLNIYSFTLNFIF